MSKKRVVVIGGGTGTHTVLQGLTKYQDHLDISAVVTMADSGGSTGRLRDEFGQLPVGDVRMALVALAHNEGDQAALLRELFLYRFDKGDGLRGHNFGNLLLVALTDILGSEAAAISAAASVLQVQGKVIPVTTTAANLVAQYADGVVVTGEHQIDEPPDSRNKVPIQQLSITPTDTTISTLAQDAIEQADLVVLGPGDLYTSILANVVVPGVADTLRTTSATLVYVCNLMTKAGQTSGMGVQEHVAEIERYVGRRPDTVLVNTGIFPDDLLDRYQAEEEFPVINNVPSSLDNVVATDFLAQESITTVSGDVLKRSLIRHDSDKLASVIMTLL